MSTQWIEPDWPAPGNVKSLVTTREGGFSQAPYDSFNLATHVGDALEDVENNRARLSQALNLEPDQFHWLSQVHSTRIVETKEAAEVKEADGIDSKYSGEVCVVMTADCLPVLLCNQSGTQVSAVHAGWRGLANGILAQAVSRFSDPASVIAWLGPAISQKHFEVGGEVRDQFIARNRSMLRAFVASSNIGKYMADLYELARIELNKLGVQSIHGGDFCTYTDQARFYSYRRDGSKSGRMASLIWLD